jgi:ribosome assembly protein RRB1
MSKRTATELQTAFSSENKKPFRGTSQKVQDEDMGEFEDGWEDEFESDEEVVDGANDDGTNVV